MKDSTDLYLYCEEGNNMTSTGQQSQARVIKYDRQWYFSQA